MAVMQSVVLASAVILALLVIEGSAIRCFECNSFLTPSCADDKPSANYSIQCTGMKHGNVSTTCRKIVQQIEFSVNGLQPDLRIIRSCAYDSSETKTKCYKRAGFGGRQVVCGCVGDDCNGAMYLQHSIAVVPVAIVVAFVAHLFHL